MENLTEVNKSLLKVFEPIKLKHDVKPEDQGEYIIFLSPVFLGMTIHRESGMTEIIRYILDENTKDFILFNPRADKELTRQYVRDIGRNGDIPFNELSKYFDLSIDEVKSLIFAYVNFNEPT